jgi:D-alanyl-D-alanine carboxypeptidase
MLQLADEGKLSLDDHVDRYLPGLVREGATIAIRELLDHTSGIPDFDSDPRVLAPYISGNLGYTWTPRRLIALAESHHRTFAPGARYSYSNTNYLVLGLIVEKLTGQPLDAVLANRIYKRWGLKSPYFQTAPSDAPSVHGYYVLGKLPAAGRSRYGPV